MNAMKLKWTLALAFIASFSIYAQNVNHVNSKTFSELIKQGDGIVLDVRTSQEYSRGHIDNSTLISTNDPKFVEKVSLLQKNKPIYIYCLTGSRSNAVARYLSQNGYTQIYNLQRGVMEWQQYGYALVTSSNPVANTSKVYDQTEFNQLIFSSDLVLIDFHAPWCAPCKKMAPIVEQLQADYSGKAVIEKIDVQSNKALQQTFNVESIPGFVLLKNGKEVWRHTGTLEYAEISTVLNQYL